jgi:uncharacterized coiled-coil protein SlyX
VFVNWEISVGNLIYLTIIAIGGLGVLFRLQSKVDSTAMGVKRLEQRQGLMEIAIKELGKATIELAVQNERMDNQDARMNRLAEEFRDLKRGHGFILDLPAPRSPG